MFPLVFISFSIYFFILIGLSFHLLSSFFLLLLRFFLKSISPSLSVPSSFLLCLLSPSLCLSLSLYLSLSPPLLFLSMCTPIPIAFLCWIFCSNYRSILIRISIPTLIIILLSLWDLLHFLFHISCYLYHSSSSNFIRFVVDIYQPLSIFRRSQEPTSLFNVLSFLPFYLKSCLLGQYIFMVIVVVSIFVI